MCETWKKRLKDDPVSWLLNTNVVTRYRTLVDIAGESPSASGVQQARRSMLDDPRVKALLREATDWLPKAPSRNSDATLSYFKLRMLADFGMTVEDDGVGKIVEVALSHRIDNMVAARGTVPTRLKKGEKYVKPDPYADVWSISPCTSPIITYILLALGYQSVLVEQAVEELLSRWTTSQGWFCHFFFVESQFKKLEIGCPMAGLMALEVLSLVPALRGSDYSRNAFQTLKFHRDYGKTIYYFGRSKKFWTLKYPFVWYNALYLADVLTRFDFLRGDVLVQELIDWIEHSQDEQGRFRPTSMYTEYKGWDFADKKNPSPWMTFLCCRILKRWYG
jgi:hypothetical protein